MLTALAMANEHLPAGCRSPSEMLQVNRRPSFSAHPTYYPGYGATIGLHALGISVHAALHFWYRNQNKRKLLGREDYRMEGLSEEEIKEIGEHNPRFIYTI